MRLTHLTDKQLINLFTVTAKQDVSPRARAILAELMTRGYYFDFAQGDFLTFEQWNARYGEAPLAPADYVLYVKLHERG